MKKRASRQQNVLKSQQQQTNDTCKICLLSSSTSTIIKQRKLNPLFQLNYELLTHTINQSMQKPTHLSTINKILQRTFLFKHYLIGQPSRQCITYQQVQKNLVFRQYLKQYFTIRKTNQKIHSLIVKHLPNVKANYMDFKIKNYLILNKYRVVNQRPLLPYPLCIVFQKQTDSKMSSTKSVQNKVLQQLDQQFQLKQKPVKGNKIIQHSNNNNNNNERTKKTNKLNKRSNEKFQIKALTKGIQQMIQNIKQARALQKFKKQMQKTSQFKYGIGANKDKQSQSNKQVKKASQVVKNITNSQNSNSKKSLLNVNNNLRQRQFKQKVDRDMLRYFPQQQKSNKNVYQSSRNLLSNHHNHHHNHHPDKQQYNLPQTAKKKPNSSSNKSKLSSFRSTQRLHTNPDNYNNNNQYEFEQYGLSVIRERQKRKSKSNKKKMKKSSHSRQHQHSRKSKQSSQPFIMSKSKRLQTQYVVADGSSSSTLRVNTNHSANLLMKSKSTSRIPTQYDSTAIIINTKQRKSKSKSKNSHQHFLFSTSNNNLSKKQFKSKGSSISSHYIGVNHGNFKKSKSKSKIKLLEFNSPSKLFTSNNNK